MTINLNNVEWKRDIDTTDDHVLGIAASIGNVGLLQPILLREVKQGRKKQLEVVDGRARVEALIKLQRYELAPENYRMLKTDDPELISFIANYERRPTTPLIEAEKIAVLTQKHDVAEIASILGRSEKFVRSRISLNGLIPKFKDALRDETFPSLKLGHYQVISGYSAQVQKQIIKDEWSLQRAGSVSNFSAGLERDYAHRLADAPFLDDKCRKCPNRSLAAPWLFEELKDHDQDRCLDPECWASRIQSHVKKERGRIVKEREKGKSNVKLISEVNKKNPDADLQFQDYEVLGEVDDPAAADAMIIDGPDAGKYVKIRENDKPANKPEPGTPASLADKRTKLQKRREKRAMEKLAEFIKHDKDYLPVPENDLFVRLLGLFGVGSVGAWCNDDIFYPGLEGVEQISNYSTDAIMERLWEKIKYDIGGRINGLTNNTLDNLHTDLALNICVMLDIDFQPYLDDASAEIPEPASWASATASDSKK